MGITRYTTANTIAVAIAVLVKLPPVGLCQIKRNRKTNRNQSLRLTSRTKASLFGYRKYPARPDTTDRNRTLFMAFFNALWETTEKAVIYLYITNIVP